MERLPRESADLLARVNRLHDSNQVAVEKRHAELHRRRHGHLVRDQQMHDAKGKRSVGSREQSNVLMTLLRCRATVRIDRYETRAAALRLLDARPQMKIRRDRIAAPDEDQAAVLELLEIHADRRTHHRNPSCFAGGRANRAIEQRGA